MVVTSLEVDFIKQQLQKPGHFQQAGWTRVRNAFEYRSRDKELHSKVQIEWDSGFFELYVRFWEVMCESHTFVALIEDDGKIIIESPVRQFPDQKEVEIVERHIGMLCQAFNGAFEAY